MAVRSTMTALITRVRLLINDPAGASQTFQDQDVQDILDESRLDVYNAVLEPKITFSGGQITYLDYLAPLGGWEDDYALKQYLTVAVTPSAVEPIVGHFQFAATTLPPVMITGKTYDIYRAAADLLDRLAAKWMLSYNFTGDGQSLQRSQALTMILDLATQYRMKQRPTTITLTRSDIATPDKSSQRTGGLGPVPNDYMASGNG